MYEGGKHAGILDDTAGNIVSRGVGSDHSDEFLHQFDKTRHLLDCSRFQSGIVAIERCSHIPHTHATVHGCMYQPVYGRVPYASGRSVYNPLESLVVIRIDSQTHVCHDILHFLALIE